MILAFTNDSRVLLFDSLEQANVHCEAIDVENHEYTFLDERGFLMKPVLSKPLKRKSLWLFSIIGPERFTLQSSEERREDLVNKLRSGKVMIERYGSSKISTLADLLKAAPLLFPGERQSQ